MKKIFLLMLLATSFIAKSQNVGIGTVPNNSAMLDINSSNKGLLIPRMSTASRINSITSPAAGLMVYDTDTKSFWFYDGTSWQSIAGGSKARSIFIPASAMTYTGTGITTTQWGFDVTNTATATPGFIMPKPVDWDTTQAFSITIYYSFPTITSGTIISWRILAGSTDLNASAANAGNGWDSYDFSQFLNASPSAIPAAPGRTNVAKTQTWHAVYSDQFKSWYVGTGVTTNNDFSNDPVWQFRFQRGYSVPPNGNGEGYTGVLTINGASINYTAK